MEGAGAPLGAAATLTHALRDGGNRRLRHLVHRHEPPVLVDGPIQVSKGAT